MQICRASFGVLVTTKCQFNISIDAEKNNMLISILIDFTDINLYLQIYPKTWTLCYCMCINKF